MHMSIPKTSKALSPKTKNCVCRHVSMCVPVQALRVQARLQEAAGQKCKLKARAEEKCGKKGQCIVT